MLVKLGVRAPARWMVALSMYVTLPNSLAIVGGSEAGIGMEMG